MGMSVSMTLFIPSQQSLRRHWANSLKDLTPSGSLQTFHWRPSGQPAGFAANDVLPAATKSMLLKQKSTAGNEVKNRFLIKRDQR